MAGKGKKENLIPMDKRSKDEVRKLGSDGGRESGKSRREKKLVREALLKALMEEVDGVPKLVLIAAKCTKGCFERGDVRDLKVIQDILGESVTNINVQNPEIVVQSLTDAEKLKEIVNATD